LADIDIDKLLIAAEILELVQSKVDAA